jgi:ubiquinone/menaquinone biosynthesis C-methylase UbiE
MDKITRQPYQGVLNIIKFNWHFYVLAFLAMCGLFFATLLIPEYLHLYIYFFISSILITTSVSLLVSYYVYDLSSLYQLTWVKDNESNIEILNIHAGFDETSYLLKAKFKQANLAVIDFYNPFTHTEISIKRARKAYPPYPGTIKSNTSNLNIADSFADKIFVTLSAHEIRNENERIVFFKELCRIIKPSGQIYVTEHLRDFSNFLAYNIGFFHFLSKTCWYATFKKANLKIVSETKITPFISSFILKKYGATT